MPGSPSPTATRRAKPWPRSWSALQACEQRSPDHPSLRARRTQEPYDGLKIFTLSFGLSVPVGLLCCRRYRMQVSISCRSTPGRARSATYLRRNPRFVARTLAALSGRVCPPTGIGFLRRVVDYATAAGYLRPNTDRITGERHAYLMSG